MLPAPFDQIPSQSLRIRTLAVGEKLFLQGDATNSIFHLSCGEIRLIRHCEAGLVVPVFRATAGDSFAEAALFSPVYHCDAVAAKPSTVQVLNKDWILSAMKSDPNFGLALAERFARQVQAYRRKLEILAIPGAEDRVLAALSDGWLHGKVIDFANEISLSHEATFRALSSLVRKKRVTRPARGRYLVTQT